MAGLQATNELALSPIIAARAAALRGPDFASRPDADGMSREDIANVERLTPAEESELLARLRLTSPTLYNDALDALNELWGDWDDDDARWELSPAELRKLPLRARHARHLKRV